MGATHSEHRAIDGKIFSLYVEGIRVPYSSLAITHGVNMTPSLSATVPATPNIVLDSGLEVGWRDLPSRSKVHVIMKDNGWTPARFVVMFEGELTSHGFERSVSSRNYQFRAQHLMANLDNMPLAVLDPVSYFLSTLDGSEQESASISASSPVGDLFSQFLPDTIAAKYNVKIEDMDIYNFAKYALRQFIDYMKASNVREAWPVKAMEAYELAERIYDPNLNITSPIGNEVWVNPPTKTVFRGQWSKFYTQIINAQLLNMLPKLGTKMTYMQMMRILTQLFLHEYLVMPNPRSFRTTLLVKPINVFNDVPTCNVIYPIYNPTYSFMEGWQMKSTRMIQVADDPYLGKEDLLRKYTRNIAPASLSALYDKFEALTDPKEKAAMSLVTEEEKVKGIVDSYNEIPGFLTSVLDLVTHSEEDVKQALSHNTEGTGVSLEGASYPSTISDLGDVADPAAEKAVRMKLIVHRGLLALEGLPNSSVNQIKGSGKAIKGAYKFKPNRITLVYADGVDLNKVHYVVKDGKVSQVKGRYFHVFEEAVGALPFALKTSYTSQELSALKAQKPENSEFSKFLFLTADSSSSVAKLAKSDTKPSLDVIIKSISGGSHQNIIVAVEQEEENYGVAAKLCAHICLLCDIPSTNIFTKIDYYAELMLYKKAEEELLKKRIVGLVAKEISSLTIGAESTLTKLNGAPVNSVKVADLTKVKPNEKNKTPALNPHSDTTSYVAPLSTISAEEAALYLLNSGKGDGAKTEKSVLDKIDEEYNKVSAFRKTDDAKTIKELVSSLKGKTPLSEIEMASLYSALGTPGFYGQAPTVSWETLFKLAIGRAMDSLKSTLAKYPTILSPIVQDKTQLKVLFLVEANYKIKKIFTSKDTDRYSSVVESIIKAGKIFEPTDIQGLRKASPSNFSFLESFQNDLLAIVTKEFAFKHNSLKSLLQVIDPSFTITTVVDNKIAQKKEEVSIADSVSKEAGASSSTPSTKDEIKYKNVWEKYTQPLAEFYFYMNRYQNSSQQLSIAFNPYITPGFSAVLLDNSEAQFHLRGYVGSIVHLISPSSLSTQVDLQYVRREDNETVEEIITTTDPTVKGGGYKRSIGDLMAGRIPFLEGEYSNQYVDASQKDIIIDQTYRKLLGCGIWNGQVDAAIMEADDYTQAFQYNRRQMQCCQITNGTAQDKAAYANNPSLVAFENNDGRFPDTINVRGMTWNTDLQAFLKAVLDNEKSREGYKG